MTGQAERSSRVVIRACLRVLGALVILLGVPLAGGWWMMIRMPGESYRGALPELTDEQGALSEDLRRDVGMLAGTIGERNLFRYEELTEAARFIETSLAAGGYAVERQEYEVQDKTCVNLAAEIPGGDLPDQIIVIGAHYDSVFGCPGANDNGTGVAATMALARALADHQPRRTLRFVLFVNEEPPFFQGQSMGSRVYARGCRQRGENVVAMLSLETIGYYRDERGTQRYPPPFGLFYPSSGNFIGFVGNVSSRRLVRSVIGAFRRHASFPSEGGALPGFIPGVSWSDHWAFWKEGYPALMVTDTAPFRYPHYHLASDTPEKIDYERMALVVSGLKDVIEEMSGRAP